MKNKEQLIEEILKKMEYILKMLSIDDLEKALKSINKSVNKIEKLGKMLAEID